RRRKCSNAIRLLADPWRHTNRTFGREVGITCFPFRAAMTLSGNLARSVTFDTARVKGYGSFMRWLTLLTSLPPKPTRHRVGVWRKLQRMGAVRLRGAGWILPETPETTELFQWLVQEIQSVGGEVTLLRVDRIETMSDAEIAALFHNARATEY